MSTATPVTKSVFLSKTFWIQIVAIAAVLVPQVQAWLTANPVEFIAVLGAVNVLVRFATSGKISLVGAGETNGGGGLGGLPLWFWVGTAAALLGGALPSCSQLSTLPIRATVIMPDGSLSYSSKAGLEATVNASERMRAIHAGK